MTVGPRCCAHCHAAVAADAYCRCIVGFVEMMEHTMQLVSGANEPLYPTLLSGSPFGRTSWDEDDIPVPDFEPVEVGYRVLSRGRVRAAHLLDDDTLR